MPDGNHSRKRRQRATPSQRCTKMRVRFIGVTRVPHKILLLALFRGEKLVDGCLKNNSGTLQF
jgi:hypothetical protein